MKPRTFLFNFKKQFAPLVERGFKLQTIRPNRKDGKRPAEGDLAKLYTGLRTRGARWLRDGIVVRCRAVRIDTSERLLIVDGARLSIEDEREFVRADGFETRDAFYAFFRDQYEAVTFEGFCVEWAR